MVGGHEGLRRLHRRGRRLPRRQHQEHRDRRRRRGRVRGPRRHALQQRLLLRLRQRRDQQRRRRRRRPWKPSTSARKPPGAPAPAAARGSWPTWRTACSPGAGAGLNSADPTIADRFTTAMVEGESNQWAILGGNAQSGSLFTGYSGVRPSGYNPMHKQGAIILGIGGDNSKSSAGTFYEGVMTSGYPSSATEAAVQANIVAAGYTTSSGNSSGATGTIVSGDDSSDCVDNNNAQRHDRQQGADVGLRRQRRRAELDRQQQRDPHHRRRLHGHHRRQVHQRHPDRAVDLQRRRQPAVGGVQRRDREPALRECASTIPARIPRTGRSSSSSPATAAATRSGRCPS